MHHAKRLAMVEVGAFAIPFLVAVPLHWVSSDTQNIVLIGWIVFTVCASAAAAHSTRLLAILLAPATIIVSVAGVYLGGYIPYALHIGNLQPSDYGCCDLGTGAEGVWARIVYGSFFGGMVGILIGVAVWLVELFFEEVGRYDTLRR